MSAPKTCSPSSIDAARREEAWIARRAAIARQLTIRKQLAKAEELEERIGLPIYPPRNWA